MFPCLLWSELQILFPGVRRASPKFWDNRGLHVGKDIRMRGSIQNSLLKVEEEDWRETEREGGLSPETRLFHYFWRGKAEQGRARQANRQQT